MATLDEYFTGRRPRLEEKVETLFGVRLNPLQRRAIKLIEETDKNIIVSAPTGSGKTLIGYAALLKEGRGFYLAPLISIMMEKYWELSRALPREYTVTVSNKDYKVPIKKFLSADIKIMSPYKFLLLSKSIEPAKHGRVVVVDEIHKMSNDPLFEAAVTIAKRKGFRIIGLSATISEPDLGLLRRWLNAEIVSGTERPVRLEHRAIRLEYAGLLYSTKRYLADDKVILDAGEMFNTREEAAATIAARIYEKYGRPVIVWAPTRSRVERIAKLIADQLPVSAKHIRIADFPASNPTEKLLRYTITKGVFIHHGGLTHNLRRMVESRYKELGGIIVTAYTLSHGVNLPGSFIILSTIYDYKGNPLDPTMYHQIAGRAGRPGYDDIGIAITILVGEDEEEYYEHVLLARTASEIKPVLLDNPVSAVKMILPVTLDKKDRIEDVLRDTFHYFKYPDEGRVGQVLRYLDTVLSYYEKIPARKRRVALEMGLAPHEYEAIETAINHPYEEAIPQIIEIVCTVKGVPPGKVYSDIMRYGFLSIWFGGPESRDIASDIQTILEAGVHYAASVYGWNSREHRKALEIAKAFTYAGNPRVEPLAREVRIHVLRRMIKAAPQIVQGASSHEDAVQATVAAVKEAFALRRSARPSRVRRLAELVWYAITGEERAPVEVIRRAVDEVAKR